MSVLAKSVCAIGSAALLGSAAVASAPAASASTVKPPGAAPSVTWSAQSSLQTAAVNYPESVSVSADGKTVIAGSTAGASDDTTSFDGTSGTIGDASSAWQPSKSISSGDRNAEDGQVLVSQDGSTALAAWDESMITANGMSQYVLVASGPIVNGQAQWGAPRVVAHTDYEDMNGDGPAVKVALSADGTRATLVWDQVGAKGMSVESVSGTVTGATQQWGAVSDFGSVEEASWPTEMAMSADGTKVVAIWQQAGPNGTSGIDVATASVSGEAANWTKPAVLAPARKGWIPGAQQVKVSSDGSRALVAWGTSKNGSSDPTELSATLDMNSESSAWTTPGVVPGVFTLSQPAQIALSADGAGLIAAGVNADGSAVVASAGTVEENGTTWGAAQPVFSVPADSTAGASSIALSENGQIATVLIDAVSNNGTARSVDAVTGRISGTTGTWSQPTSLDPNDPTASSPYLAASADGSTVVAVWQVMGADTETLRAATATVSAP